MSSYRAHQGKIKRDLSRVDYKALCELSARTAVSREVLQALGYIWLAGYGDLHPHGYNVKALFNPYSDHLLYEMTGRLDERVKVDGSHLPRILIDTYEDQAALHRALGIIVTAPGEPWEDRGVGQRSLFESDVVT